MKTPLSQQMKAMHDSMEMLQMMIDRLPAAGDATEKRS